MPNTIHSISALAKGRARGGFRGGTRPGIPLFLLVKNWTILVLVSTQSYSPFAVDMLPRAFGLPIKKFRICP